MYTRTQITHLHGFGPDKPLSLVERAKAASLPVKMGVIAGLAAGVYFLARRLRKP